MKIVWTSVIVKLRQHIKLNMTTRTECIKDIEFIPFNRIIGLGASDL
jgi:hypothetical protein